MKLSHLLLATTAILAGAACNAEKGGNSTGAASTPIEAVKPPADGDWSTVVTQTSTGGFLMGNPDAKVKLAEFGSLTCPHCAKFDEIGVPPLVEKYVKSGQVSYEFRNYVRDPFDITVALIARCNGSKSFFPLTQALFRDQSDWVGRLQTVPQDQIETLTAMGPERQFLEIAKVAGMQQWAAMRGVPTAKSTQCLTDQAAVNQLVQMNSDATNEYPNMQGTPTFVINGKMVENAATWELLEPKIREALGS
jgi:protein-disulfide isomerase